MSQQFAIEDVGSMGRRNSPPFDDPNNQLALPGQSGRGALAIITLSFGRSQINH